ncbi:FadR/GntR family transcriptional regulator [Nakamurella lactea]|uniref:FadR/GntR family transcriptional regulator n=1 Tax=Nakamurella lactea TaxID=459515 RepID=UPI00048D9667|nr:GntR family transcriptional regulator [Nakamurella lactea]
MAKQVAQDGGRGGKPGQVAAQIRSQILDGQFSDGDLLGRELELIDRFGVSRPSLREALRILEAEGLVSVLRGASGGVVVHRPNQEHLARAAAMVFQARNIRLDDVFAARAILEPAAVKVVAGLPHRVRIVGRLRYLIEAQRLVIEDPVLYGQANASFHTGLVACAGNETLSTIAQMLDEIVARAVTAVSMSDGTAEPVAVRRRGLRSQERLVACIENGETRAAEQHWKLHMEKVGRVMLGQRASTVVDLLDHE